jgi:hypothetical protein
VNSPAGPGGRSIRFLLDEHYPPALACALRQRGVDTVSIIGDRAELIGAPDAEVLRLASAEGRVVVTEDVSTFPQAARWVPGHVGTVYCLSRTWPRTPSGIAKLERALDRLAADPPAGLGELPLVWWLPDNAADDGWE